MSSTGGKSEPRSGSSHKPPSRSGSSKDVSRSSTQLPSSDGESAKGSSRGKKTRTTSESSRDSSQGSSRNLKDSKENVKEGKSHRRTPSQGHKRDKSNDGEGGGGGSGAKNKTKNEKTKPKEGLSSNDSENVNGGGTTPTGSMKGEGGPDVSEEDHSASLDEAGGGHRTPRTARKIDLTSPVRLLVLSSKIKNSSSLLNALLGNVLVSHYKYESSTLDTLLSSIHQQIHNHGGMKMESIVFIVHSTTNTVYLTGKDEKCLNNQTVTESIAIRDFFSNLIKIHLDYASPHARLDFLACNVTLSDAKFVTQELESLVNVPVGLSKEVTGADIPLELAKASCVGELYFRIEKLKNWSAHNQQTLAGFEKIRTVGKGAYGTAVLYRKKDDDSLVILKEINLHDLNASERQLALNEVKVLAMLDHPNIISYYDSFEEDGIVMIEMEYADGGTLAQYLSQQDKPLEEREVLAMFQQVVAAIKHIHDHNILHRDLKTANIFLTKEGVVKVGDFGISKLMSTANQANTVLGTPYYISPEMCEGKAYNEKSDIWALGCILYEMACLQKTFEGSNLPALVNKIMKGQFAPVKELYSTEFKNLVQDMLQRDPENRPSSATLWHNILPELLSKYDDPVTDYEDENNSVEANLGKKRKTSSNVTETRSVLYYFEMSNMSLTPIALPSKVKIRDVAVGSDHVIVVTVERMVYTWGDGSRGQLGHGDLESRVNPQPVEALRGKSIIRACCGKGFSVFASDNGIVMTSGDGASGCLGHGDWCSATRPRLIEALLSVDVIAMACGPEHVVVVGSEGEVFSWGQGAGGRLGLGSDDNVCQPTEVTFADTGCVRDVRCGLDGTMLITDVGSVLACGNNEYNKLGLNQRQGFLMAMKNIFNKTEVEGQKVFTLVKALARHRVVDISMGPSHSSVVVEPGHVYTLGKNTEGQLGNGNTKLQNAPIAVKVFEDKLAFRVQCGPVYSVGGTTDNDLLYWGLRYKQPPTPKLDDSFNSLTISEIDSHRGHSRMPSTASVSSSKSATDLKDDGGTSTKLSSAGAQSLPLERQNSTESLFSEKGSSFSSGGFRPLSSTQQRKLLSSVNSKEKEKDGKDDFELILQPTPLLHLDASGTRSKEGDTVTLSNFYCHGENLFIEVETTAPAPKRKSRKRRHFRKRFSNSLEVPEGAVRMSASSREGGDEYSSEASEHDTFGTIPAWLKEELAHSERDINDENEADVSDYEPGSGSNFHPDASMTSIHINKNLKTSGKMAPATINAVKRSSYAKDNHGKLNKHIEATSEAEAESNAEPSAVDPLSSSSSSDAMAHNADKAKPVGIMKKMNPAPVRKVAGPVPYKSKVGPSQGQKPLNRLRANKQRSRGSGDLVKDAALDKGDAGGNKIGTQTLLLELERLKAEKKNTEQRLRNVETEHVKQKELLEKQQASSAQEQKLKEEISHLKGELKYQSSQLQNNHQVVQSLQEQLEKIQSVQVRQSAQDAARSKSKQSVQKESKICVIQ